MHMSIITLYQLKQRKYSTIFCALAALQPMRGFKNLFELKPEFIVLKFKTFIYIFSNYALKYFFTISTTNASVEFILNSQPFSIY